MIKNLQSRLDRLAFGAGCPDGQPATESSSLPAWLRKRDEHALRHAIDELPGQILDTSEGGVHVARTVYPPSYRHGGAPIADAFEVGASDLAWVALDETMQSFSLERALFIDTETTGLQGGTGTIPFLIGTGSFDSGSFVVEQIFLREPAAERAALSYLSERLAAAAVIVSFNGKTFDMPLLRTRYLMSRLRQPSESPHFDLLHACRRVYRRRLGECRLSSLESRVLGFEREGDVPGSMIPGIYQDFLWSGATAMLEAVFTHNAQDVVALPALLGALGRACSDPGQSPEPDRIGLAHVALRNGSVDRAARILGDVQEREGKALVATALRRRGERAQAAQVWRDIVQRDPHDAEAHLQLAKHAEHVERDYARALVHARATRDAESEICRCRRIARLERKLGRS